MKVGFGTTALARSRAHGGVDGIGSYTRELGQALIARGGVDLVPAGFGVTVGDDVFPGARPAVNLGRHEIATVLGAVTPWTSIDETVLRAERVDVRAHE